MGRKPIEIGSHRGEIGREENVLITPLTPFQRARGQKMFGTSLMVI